MISCTSTLKIASFSFHASLSSSIIGSLRRSLRVSRLPFAALMSAFRRRLALGSSVPTTPHFTGNDQHDHHATILARRCTCEVTLGRTITESPQLKPNGGSLAHSSRAPPPGGLGFSHSTGIFWSISCKMTSAIKAALREASAGQAAACKSESPALLAAVYPQLCPRRALLVKSPDWSSGGGGGDRCKDASNREMMK